MSEEPVIVEGIGVPANRAMMVANPAETIAARVHFPEPGVYFIAARFISAASVECPYRVEVCANGQHVWSEALSSADATCVFRGLIRLQAPGFVDFATNVDQGPPPAVCRTIVEYAVFCCDEKTGSVQLRCDDGISGLDDLDALSQYDAIPFSPVDIAAPKYNIEDRAALFQREWTLKQDYIESQFQQSPSDLTKLLLKDRKEASLKYCVFMVPRSASTLLAELFARTKKLGFPSELFVPDMVRSFSLAFSDQSASYEQFLTHRLQTENGVFGIEIDSVRLQEESRFFADIGSWRHVYIWREDVLAQAISLQISLDTGVWHSFSSDPGKDSFHYISRNLLIERINFLLGTERFFRDYFSKNNLAPYPVSYETLVADPIGEARRIAQHIGVECTDADFRLKGKAALQPTAKARNAYYKLLAIAGGGEMWGYDIVQENGRFMAVLHGVDRSLLDTSIERSPILILGSDEASVREKVNHLVMRQIGSMPKMDDAPRGGGVLNAASPAPFIERNNSSVFRRLARRLLGRAQVGAA